MKSIYLLSVSSMVAQKKKKNTENLTACYKIRLTHYSLKHFSAHHIVIDYVLVHILCADLAIAYFAHVHFLWHVLVFLLLSFSRFYLSYQFNVARRRQRPQYFYTNNVGACTLRFTLFEREFFKRLFNEHLITLLNLVHFSHYFFFFFLFAACLLARLLSRCGGLLFTKTCT